MRRPPPPVSSRVRHVRHVRHAATAQVRGGDRVADRSRVADRYRHVGEEELKGPPYGRTSFGRLSGSGAPAGRRRRTRERLLGEGASPLPSRVRYLRYSATAQVRGMILVADRVAVADTHAPTPGSVHIAQSRDSSALNASHRRSEGVRLRRAPRLSTDGLPRGRGSRQWACSGPFGRTLLFREETAGGPAPPLKSVVAVSVRGSDFCVTRVASVI
jgi:hypothetical protein